MKKQLPIHEQAQLSISPESLDCEVELFPAREVVWERILCLASLVRAIDPELGGSLRFVKRAPLEAEDRNAVDFDIFMTHSTDRDIDYKTSMARRSSVLVKNADVTLEAALRKVLPSDLVDHEMGLINNSPAYGFASGAAAAIQEAFVKGHIALKTKILLGQDLDADATNPQKTPKEVWVTSAPVSISDTQFMRHPTVARWVWMAPNARESAEDPRIASAVTTIRKDVLRLRELLNKSFAKTSPEDRTEVVDSIMRLNANRNARPSFEEVFDHSWVGYALARRNGTGWTQFLVDNANCNPNGRYAGQSPMAIALGQDDASSLDVLLQKGLSANSRLPGYPQLYSGQTQNQINERDERHVSFLLFASVIQASKSAKVLLGYGADPDFKSDKGVFPLLEAAGKGDFTMARVLLENGANPAMKDDEGATAEEYVSEEDDVFYRFLKEARVKAEAAADANVNVELEFNVLKDALKERRQSQKASSVPGNDFPSDKGISSFDSVTSPAIAKPSFRG